MNAKKQKLLIISTALSAGTLLISNLAAIKLWDFAGIAVDGGLVLFPLTYILGDLIVEFFGEKLAKTILVSSFLVNLIAVVVFYVVIALPPYPGWTLQEAYTAVLGFSPRIILGSLCGYLLANLVNNFLFVKMKQSNSIFSKSFIARALGSSVFAHILDSATFETIAFLGILPFSEFVAQAVFAYLLGMLLEVVLSPLEVWIERLVQHQLKDSSPIH